MNSETQAPAKHSKSLLVVFLVILICVIAITLTNNDEESPYRRTSEATNSTTTLSNTDNLVKDHVRLGKAYLTIYQVFDDRASRSMIIKGAYAIKPKLNPFRETGPALRSLRAAVTTNNQGVARIAITILEKEMAEYVERY